MKCNCGGKVIFQEVIKMQIMDKKQITMITIPSTFMLGNLITGVELLSLIFSLSHKSSFNQSNVKK